MSDGARLPAAGLAQLGGSVVLLASGWPVTKQAITLGASPIWFAAGRTALSALVVFAIVAAIGRLRLPGRRDLPALLGVGLLQLGVFFAFSHLALAWVPAGRSAVLSNVTTIFIVPLSLVVLGEHIPWRRWVAAGMGVAGVVVLMGPWAIDWTRRDVVIGHLFLLVAAASFSMAIVLVRRWPPALAMLQLLPWCFVLATLVLVPLALVHARGIGGWPGPALWALVFVGAFAGPIGTWCIMEAAAALPAMISSVGLLATPAVGLLMATWWLGERLGPDLLAGTALILGGVGVATWPRRA